ncbi:unnamed protein product, partial [marine sediment metagenome]
YTTSFIINSGGIRVRDVSSKYGNSAGKIWQILEEKGCLKKDEIIQTINLDETEFHTAIGWLARENKIAQEDDCYKLEDTNLEPEISDYAGKVWKILDIWGDADLETIKRLSDLDESQVYTAIGWLAREEKVYFNENNRLSLK